MWLPVRKVTFIVSWVLFRNCRTNTLKKTRKACLKSAFGKPVSAGTDLTRVVTACSLFRPPPTATFSGNAQPCRLPVNDGQGWPAPTRGGSYHPSRPPLDPCRGCGSTPSRPVSLGPSSSSPLAVAPLWPKLYPFENKVCSPPLFLTVRHTTNVTKLTCCF